MRRLSRSAAPANVDAAAAICSVLALCSSLDAATYSIAAEKESVPAASESSFVLISSTNPLAAVDAR